MRKNRPWGWLCVFVAGVVLLMAGCQPAPKGYSVHDMSYPQPPIVTPGVEDRLPPSDAIVLFDGTDLSAWTGGAWKVENGYMEVVPKSGDLSTKEAFGSCQLHLEWATPTVIEGNGQNRGNSGVFLMSRYEVQILDSYQNITYPDGQAAAIYGQYPPLVNASRAPGQWQTYDIIFRRPIFDKNGKLVRPARITVLHNGVLVQDNVEFQGATAHKQRAVYKPHPDKLPLTLQDHHNPVRFRNIWIRPLAD